MIDELPEDQQRRMMEKLLGRDNAARITKQRPGDRPFRPAPVRVTYEFYEVPGQGCIWPFWRINRVENGRAEFHARFGGEAECLESVRALRAKGFTVRQVVPSDFAGKRDRSTSQRSVLLSRLKDFKP